ncbi:MAG: methyltransferase [Gemmatimonadota bacterium]
MPAPPPDSTPFTSHTAEALLLVTAALETGLLQLLERERTVSELARERGLDARAVAICLDALVELGVVERGRRGLRLTTFGRARFVDRASTTCLGGGLGPWRAQLRGWLFLDDVLRTGEPLPEDRSREFRARLYRSLDQKPAARVEALVERVLARAPGPRSRVLDVGGGSGVLARAFLARGCAVTLLELPEVLRHVRDAFGLDRLEGLTLVEGDLRERLPEGPFEVILVADVLHALSPAEARALVRAAAAVSARGAVLAIAEALLGRSRGAGLLGVAMLLATPEGRSYAEEEVGEWAAAAGFVEPEVVDLDPAVALFTARRESRTSRGSG